MKSQLRVFGSQSAVPTEFRPFNKKPWNTLGPNPNVDVEDEYIENLQQQIHFMELELKLLKQKQDEEEKSGGIANLFMDEKTSMQHIVQLKDKYKKMKKELELKIKGLIKDKLGLDCENHVLNERIAFLKAHLQKITDQKNELEELSNKNINEAEIRLQGLVQNKKDLDNDVERLKKEIHKEYQTHLEKQTSINKDKANKSLRTEKINELIENQKNMIDQKRKQIEDYEEGMVI